MAKTQQATTGTPRPTTFQSAHGRSPGSRVLVFVRPSQCIDRTSGPNDKNSPLTVAGAAPVLADVLAAPDSLLALDIDI
jgi:hypothetical protein